MVEQYFITRSTDDGPGLDGPMSKEELLKRITPDKDGYTHYGEALKFSDKIPDFEYGEQNTITIIRGEIIQPRAVETVKSFEI